MANGTTLYFYNYYISDIWSAPDEPDVKLCQTNVTETSKPTTCCSVLLK